MKKVIFALPGREFSNRFLVSWTELLYACLQNDIQPVMSSHYSPLLYFVRNMCLGGDTLRGVDQKPFGGNLDYDYIMWIDSDIVFTPDQFFKLLSHDRDIVSGLYMMQDNKHYATVEQWDEDYYKQKGHFPFLDRQAVSKRTDLFPVSYTGLGWMLVKKGVFESLKYPWFHPIWAEYMIDDKLVREFTMEDVAFCRTVTEKGYNIWIDPSVVVGHEKLVVL